MALQYFPLACVAHMYVCICNRPNGIHIGNKTREDSILKVRLVQQNKTEKLSLFHTWRLTELNVYIFTGSKRPHLISTSNSSSWLNRLVISLYVLRSSGSRSQCPQSGMSNVLSYAALLPMLSALEWHERRSLVAGTADHILSLPLLWGGGGLLCVLWERLWWTEWVWEEGTSPSPLSPHHHQRREGGMGDVDIGWKKSSCKMCFT